MKKTILGIILGISMLFALNLETNAQGSVLVQGGYSWSEGVVAAGFQWVGVSTTIGYMPAKMPGDGSSVSGVVWNVKLGPEYDESGYYLSYALNTVGYRSQMNYNSSGWTDNYVEAMNILSIGYKVGTYSGMYLAADVGYGWSASGKGMSWGITLGMALGNL